MIDGNEFRVLIPKYNNADVLLDRTESIKWSNPESGYIRGQFRDGGAFGYRHPKARFLKRVTGFRALRPTERIKARGEVWRPPLAIATFTDVYDGSYSIVRFYRDNMVIGASYLYRPDDLTLLVSSASTGGGAGVFEYWKETARMLAADDPTRPAFESI